MLQNKFSQDFIAALEAQGWWADMTDDEEVRIGKMVKGPREWLTVHSSWKHLYRTVARLLACERFKTRPGYGHMNLVMDWGSRWSETHYVPAPYGALDEWAEEYRQELVKLLWMAKQQALGESFTLQEVA